MKKMYFYLIKLNPNPAKDYIEIYVGTRLAVFLLLQDYNRIYNTLGECVLNLTPSPSPSGEGRNIKINASGILLSTVGLILRLIKKG